jgi:phosphatidylglycerophosphatase A
LSKRLNLATFIASAGGIGFVPGAPGTYASVAAIGIYMLIVYFFHTSLLLVPLILAAMVAGVIIGPKVERTLGQKDPRQFVLDEFAGAWMAVVGFGANWMLPVAAAGFVLFRIFDIWKPRPVKDCERLPAGWGIMLDDVVAGAMANLTIWVIYLGSNLLPSR